MVLLTYFEKLKIFLRNMVAVLMMSAKMATSDLLKIKKFWNRGYHVIIYVHDVTNLILSHQSNCIVDMVMWPNFGNSSIYTREVIRTSILLGFEQKNHCFEEWFCLKFNNFGLALSMALETYTNMAKGFKLKVRMF